METASGKQNKPSFDPQLIANFQQVWDNIFHRPWRFYTKISRRAILIIKMRSFYSLTIGIIPIQNYFWMDN